MPKRYRTTVTHLEMRENPRVHCPPPFGHYALFRAVDMPIHFYRYLYHVVGHNHVWVHRKKLDDEALAAIVHSPNVEIYVLYLDGSPAGFFELDLRHLPRAELSFLGIVPEFIGRGLGRFLLCEAIRTAWDRNPSKVTIQTCTLDHPRALPLYQRHGFVPYAQEEVELEDDGEGPGF